MDQALASVQSLLHPVISVGSENHRYVGSGKGVKTNVILAMIDSSADSHLSWVFAAGVSRPHSASSNVFVEMH